MDERHPPERPGSRQNLPYDATPADPDGLAERVGEGQVSGMSDRLARLEGSYDALKVVRPMTITVLGVLLAALIFVLSFMAAELRDLNIRQQAIEAKFDATNAKIDTIPGRLAEEFRAMRAEMAAQTNAIANSITAARQFQPQVLLVPAPQASPPNGEPPADQTRQGTAPPPPARR
jgi:hypothetical protein